MLECVELNFLDNFQSLTDPRSTKNRLYPVSEILLTTLCAVICGAEGWQHVEDYGNSKLDFLRKLLPYKKKIPSDDTFRRFFRAVDPKEFQELFRNWITNMQPKISESVIAIDGKSSRHSFDTDKEMLHMISAYSTELRVVLAQEKVDDKSNEITAIPKLLSWLDLKNNIVTIDAMGCQVAIANQIVARQGGFIFALKGNQGNLQDDVKTYLTDGKMLQHLKFHSDYEKGHGRIETRTCWVAKNVGWLHNRHPQWLSVKSIIRVDSQRETKSKISSESRYFISSLEAPPEKMLQSIRSHWAIENSLHWVLDMSFGEDRSRIRKQNAPQVMAIFRHIAQNLLQLTKAQMKRQSIKRLKKIAGWDNATLSFVLSQKIS